MEAALKQLASDGKRPASSSPLEADKVADALQKLHAALQSALPLLIDLATTAATPAAAAVDGPISVSWLLDLCRSVPSDWDAFHLAQAIVEAAHLTDPVQQETALFDTLGASEEAMHVLLQVAPALNDIRNAISMQDLFNYADQHQNTTTTTVVDVEEERRQFLLQQALDAAQVAAVAQAEVDELMLGSRGATHTVLRTSERQAQKFAEKAARNAKQALQRAKEAGAILDESDLLRVDRSQLGAGGLLQSNQQDLWALQQSLLPEGSREYYDAQRGLPKNAVRVQEEGMEKVVIPALQLSPQQATTRLKIADIMDEPFARAFEGTQSLNPMQSETFQVAFHSRDNMMVCAPTGAGKTNVALLAAVAHFRDVGLIASSGSGSSAMETGTKVVYIAPMKALAQEVTEKFQSKLKSLRLIVRELTGDMQLTRAEAESANVIVTTPEKWDVVTRKSGNDDNSLGNQCGLLIIDEVHLLADERGAVIESVVARLHRLVESRQRQVRIVALSATLPNYDDVANFLQVHDRGVFYFGPEHRPVPLQQTFIGLTVNVKDRWLKEKRMNEVCYDVVVDSLKRGYQVMVFVHSRKGTGDTLTTLAEIGAARDNELEHYFVTQGKDGYHGEAYVRYADRAKKSRNREVTAHFANGMGLHHAGMLRPDRKLTEQMFNDGAIKVLCCTATLAWGINLPAHTVVIKGTDVYNPEKGGIVDLSILDVQQIFGRAGRPQFDTSGEATLITTYDAFPRYMDKLVRPIPIESNFTKQLADHLNAEVVGGTVTNLQEGVQWLTYSYLYIRMMRNPLAYGINADQKFNDPMLRTRCLELVTEAAKLLDSNKMLRYHKETGNLGVVDSGRIAAHFYIQAESVTIFNETLARLLSPSDSDLCRLICSATEFKNMKLRQEEMDELQKVARESCPFKIRGAGGDDAGLGLITSEVDKAFVLLQAYISRAKIRSFTLISDMNYIAANAGRVARALFEMCLTNQKAGAATKFLRITKSVDNQNWWFRTPLRHFESELKEESVFSSIETGRLGGNSYDTFETVLSILDMQPDEVAQLCRCSRKTAGKIRGYVQMFPKLYVSSCDVKPITAGVVKVHVELVADFEWHVRWHGGAQSFWFWVEAGDKIYHHEHITFSRRTYAEPRLIETMIPTFSNSTTQYYVRIVADGWIGVEHLFPVPIKNIELPIEQSPHTDLLDLTPLPTTALNNPKYEQLYSSKFSAFNPIQTQLFHTLYYTDSHVLLGAPTGSGKTIVAELAILRMKKISPKGICVYIAPLKALARERLKEWQGRLGSAPLNWSVLELSSDTHHDQRALQQADVLVCTPEKYDLLSRGWRRESQNHQSFVLRVRLLVIDEAHLLGEDRGGCLEAIVSRTRLISRHVAQGFQDESNRINGETATMGEQELTRIIGLTTALANSVDLADWMGIKNRRGLYNFRPSVRPVPTSIHVQGYSGKHYCPRMATMNKPCFAAIKEHSPTKPTLIFVASRRQTRLTAFDIISYAAGDDAHKMFLGCSDDYVDSVAENISDEALRHTITFGIGLHHAGLSSADREIAEKMFLDGKIKVLVATATLAWGVNLPAHLVIVKGTEYFDGKSSRYVDYPLTDVLQMIGRAGRPGFDTEAVAVVMVQSEKKNFYKKFLYTPFPVESCLEQRINENLNAEIVSRTITSITDGVAYLRWTFFARRVKANPSYYGVESSSDEDVQSRLFRAVEDSFARLRESGCIESVTQDSDEIQPTVLGMASSQFYLLYRTPKQMQIGLRQALKIIANALMDEGPSKMPLTSSGSPPKVHAFMRSREVDELSISWLFYVLCSTHEFDELPVRHNEEFLNQELSEDLMWGPDTSSLRDGNKNQHRDIEIFRDPHTKGFLLIQAYLEYAKLPISDYVNDTKSVVENIPRLLAALTHVATGENTTAGAFELLTQLARVRQLFKARARVDSDPLLQLPGITAQSLKRMQHDEKDQQVPSLFQVRALERKVASSLMQRLVQEQGRKNASAAGTVDALYRLPGFRLKSASITTKNENGSNKSIGILKIELEVDREKAKRRSDDSVTLILLVGSMQQKFLLARETVTISRFGTFSLSKELIFDWSCASADGGEGSGAVILRLLVDEIRGLDAEVILQLK